MSHASARREAGIDARASAAVGASRAGRALAGVVAAVEAGWDASWARRVVGWPGAGAGRRAVAPVPAAALVAAATALALLSMQGAHGATALVPALVAAGAAGWTLLGRARTGRRAA